MATIRTTLADLVNFSNMVPSPPPMPVYDKFLGLELTPANVLFLQTTVVSFFAQFVLFYTTWFFFPSFGKDRRRLAWVSSFYCSLFLSIAVMAELGMVRTTVFERLGMDTVTLGLPANATLFSYLLPKFNAWALQLGSNHVKGSRDGLSVILQQLQEWNAESVSVLAGTFLRWMVNQPIFSLAPLKPVDPAYIVEGAPYYFGGGGRLLFSMEGAHQSSRMGAVMVGYVAGYFLADNVLAALHFFAHHSYLSGWVHHIAYTGVAYSLAKHHTLSLFSICVGTFEPSTIFLALGHMFPAARCDLVFGTTFFVLRIVLCALFLHEFAFNHPCNTGGATQTLTACLTLHSYWFVLIAQGVVRRAKRAGKEKAKAKTKKLGQDQEQSEVPQKDKITTDISRSVVQLRFRPNKNTGYHSQ